LKAEKNVDNPVVTGVVSSQLPWGAAPCRFSLCLAVARAVLHWLHYWA